MKLAELHIQIYILKVHNNNLKYLKEANLNTFISNLTKEFFIDIVPCSTPDYLRIRLRKDIHNHILKYIIDNY